MQDLFVLRYKECNYCRLHVKLLPQQIKPRLLAVCKPSPYIFERFSTLRIKPFLPYVPKQRCLRRLESSSYRMQLLWRAPARHRPRYGLFKQDHSRQLKQYSWSMCYVLEVQAFQTVSRKALALRTDIIVFVQHIKYEYLEWSCLNSSYLGRWRAGARQRSCIRQLDDSSLRKHRCFGTYGKNGLMRNVEKRSKMYGDGLQTASRRGLIYYGSQPTCNN